MNAKRVLIVLVLAGPCSTAGAQSPWDEAAAKLRSASLSQEQAVFIAGQARARGLAPVNVEAWAESIARLAQSGIPSAIAAERLAQGLAKGVPVERLDRGLADLGDNLRWLNALLERTTARAERRKNPGQSELALRAGEAALRAGFARAQLQRAVGSGPLTLEQAIALSQAAGTLLATNVAPADVVGALEGLGEAGVGASAIRELERRFVASVAAGQPVQDAFKNFSAGASDLIRGAGEAAKGAVQRDELRQEFQEELRQTFHVPGGLGVYPQRGASPAAAGHSKAPPR